MKFLQQKSFQWSMFGLVLIVATIMAIRGISPEKRDLNGYDEQMWTSSSISSYSMYFKGYTRKTKELDNWFATYAWKNKVPVFTGQRWEQFSPDTIKFPYDFVTVHEKRGSYSIVVKYDTLVFPRKKFQWYDREMWTFGWKAPNLGKYVMGWAIYTFASSKPDPNAYFSYYIPEQYVDSLNSKRHVPSTKLGSATFSYAPEEYVFIARKTNAVFIVLTVLITFLLAWRFINFWTGLVSGLWLAVNKTFIDVNVLAGLDSPAVFFSTASLLGLLYTMMAVEKNEKWWKILVGGAVTGILTGCAVSSKLNAGMLVYAAVLIYAVAGVFMLLRLRKTAGKTGAKQAPASGGGWKNSLLLKGISSGLLVGLLSVGVFVRLNPQVQGDPMGKMRTMQQSIDDYFTRRSINFTQNQLVDRMKAINAELVTLAQAQKIPVNDANSINQRLQQVNMQLSQGLNGQPEDKQRAFLQNKAGKLADMLAKIETDMLRFNPQFKAAETDFVNWVDVKDNWTSACSLVLRRIAVVEDEKTRYYGTIGSLVKFPYNSLDGLFAIAGLVFLAWLAYRQTRERRFAGPLLIILLSFILVFYGNVDFVWQDWPRYMTPIFPLYAILVGVGMVESVRWIIARTKAGKKPAATK